MAQKKKEIDPSENKVYQNIRNATIFPNIPNSSRAV